MGRNDDTEGPTAFGLVSYLLPGASERGGLLHPIRCADAPKE
jgi:hypothetical protein